MGELVAIRPAVVTDLPELIGLLAMLFAIEADFRPDQAKQRRGLELLLQTQEQGRACILVAQNDASRILGMCTAQLVVSTAEGALSGWIEDVAVAPEYRKQGIGRSLLSAIGEWCFRQGATRIQLLADRANEPALQFYNAIGWQQTQLLALRKQLNTDLFKAAD